jgi:monofunctional biosynthetic peptidoglycan transglycosylase
VTLSLVFDAAAWEDLALDVKLSPRCRVTREPALLEAMLPRLRGGKRARQALGAARVVRPLPIDSEHPDYVALSRMPPWLPAAFITAEDGRFFAHQGFDLENIRRALAHDFEVADFAKGASTITQQVAKNLFLGPERTFARKLEELVLAWRLHDEVAKSRILELYLNIIELGPGIRGVKRAAQVYFGKPVSDLSALEAAHLAALTPNPVGYARRFREGRVDEGWLLKLYDLLGMMKRSGRLTEAELAAARNEHLTLNRI